MFKEEPKKWQPKTLLEAIEGEPRRRDIAFTRLVVPQIRSVKVWPSLRETCKREEK